MKCAIRAEKLTKKFGDITLGGLDFEIPAGFTTVIIGAAGSGKTTLLDLLCGIRTKTGGRITYFDSETDVERLKERIGYCAPQEMFPSFWRVYDAANSCAAAFNGFDCERFRELCCEMGIDDTLSFRELSRGDRTLINLATVFARDTDLLVLDEPAAALDPLERERLCERFRGYIADGGGEKSIIFTAHDVADMENAADFALFISGGDIIESGFAEDLKEKYIIVRGDSAVFRAASLYLLTSSENEISFDGLALAENKEKLEALGASAETPTLKQLSVELIKMSEEKEWNENVKEA